MFSKKSKLLQMKFFQDFANFADDAFCGTPLDCSFQYESYAFQILKGNLFSMYST